MKFLRFHMGIGTILFLVATHQTFAQQLPAPPPSVVDPTAERQAIVRLLELRGVGSITTATKPTSTQMRDVASLPAEPLAVHTLDWKGTNATDDDFAVVRNLARIVILRLPSVNVTDRGLQNVRGLTTLTELRLNGNRITDAGLKHLEGLSNLKILDLNGTLVSPGGIAALQAKLPGCKIISRNGTLPATGNSTVTAQATKYPDVLTKVPAPNGVTVKHVHPMIAVPISEIATGKYPAVLNQAIVFTRPIQRYAPSNEAGRLEVSFTTDGVWLLAASWSDGDGYAAGAKEALTQTQLIEKQYWLPYGRVRLRNSLDGRAEDHTLFWRQCRAGEKLVIRTRRQHPAFLITPSAAAQRPDLLSYEPDRRLPEGVQGVAVQTKSRLLLERKDFESLEKWADGYLLNDAMYPSGRYKMLDVWHPYSFPISGETEQLFQDRLKTCDQWLARYPKSAAARLMIAGAALRYSVFLMYQRETDGPARVPDVRRRALEALFEIEQLGRAHPVIYTSYLRLAAEDWWDEELALNYLDKSLETGKWCDGPTTQVLGILLFRARRLNEPERSAKRVEHRELVESIINRTKAKYGDAMYAAMVRSFNPQALETVFDDGVFEWPRAKTSFVELMKLFPDSARTKQIFCRYACCMNDRETAQQLFKELGEFGVDDEKIWYSDYELRAHRRWAMDDLASGEQHKTIEHPQGSVAAVAWIDGQKILYSDHFTRLWLCDVETGQKTRFGTVTIQEPLSLAVNTSSAQALSGTYFGNLSLVNYTAGSYRKLAGGRDDLRTVSLSEDGRWACAGSAAGAVAIYQIDLPSKEEFQKPTRTLQSGNAQGLLCSGFSRDAATLVTCGRNGVAEVWDVESGELRKSWKVHPKRTRAATLSRDATRLATIAPDGTIALWNTDDKTLVKEIIGGKILGQSVALSDDGKLLAIGTGISERLEPEQIRVYELATGSLLQTLNGHKGAIVNLAFARDGRTIASAGHDMTIRIWRLAP